MTKNFLAFVGVAYFVLAVWCIVKPTTTSNSVGLTLNPGSGQSEYLVVYGGLQLGLGLFFLCPLLRPETTSTVLLSCLLIHGCLVLMRTLSLMLYAGLQTTTYVLAVVEWAVFIGSIWFRISLK